MMSSTVTLSQISSLLDAGARVSLDQELSVEPLLVEVVRYRKKMADLTEWLDVLLEAGADPTAPSRSGQNALLTCLDTLLDEKSIIHFYKKCIALWKEKATFRRLFVTSADGISILHLLAMNDKSDRSPREVR
jgi:hypothetical protein